MADRTSSGPTRSRPPGSASRQRGAPHVALADLPDAPGGARAGRRASPEALSALPPPSRLPEAGASAASAACSTAPSTRPPRRTMTPRARGRAEAGPAPELPAQDILRFARGPSAGDCLHAAFERADFADPASWDGAIERALG
ncbi:MAG: hypothetical protein MZW92_66280, partial [Comamonadaceae bacterium]|nr:hypothetical protein [Comamonadaceae bacterium]